MNRRSLLTLIGFAPIATAVAALPRVADPVKLASTGGREVSAKAPFVYEGGKLYFNNVYTGIVVATDPFRGLTCVTLEGAPVFPETQNGRKPFIPADQPGEVSR